MGLYNDLNLAGLLAIGLTPEWVDVAEASYEVPPSSAASGVYLQGAPVVLLSVDLREEVHRRTSRVVITTADLTTTVYTVTIDGNAVVYDASSELPADATALVAGIASAIDSDGTVGAIVDAVADPDAPTTTILITGKSKATYSISAKAVSGTGALTCNADAATAKLQVYFTAGGIVKSGSTGSPNRWKAPPSGLWDIDRHGFTERLDCAGFDRVAVELHTIAGHANDGAASGSVSITQNVAAVMVGPSVLESTDL